MKSIEKSVYFKVVSILFDNLASLLLLQLEDTMVSYVRRCDSDRG